MERSSKQIETIFTTEALLMSVLANIAIEQLIHMGVRDFCICPGSRSTPLTVAIARHPRARSHIFHDERSAAFCALGFGKAGKVAVLITTSGTAVANALPAVVEANMSNVPLLLMTADRPPELRSTNANQTVDQIKLFSDQVRFFFDVPCASQDYPSSSLQNTLCFALAKCTGTNAGPVHLNWMFREPFDISVSTSESIDDISLFTMHSQGYLHPTATQRSHIRSQITSTQKGLLVIGELTDPSEIEWLRNNLHTVQWPIIIDASSGLSSLKHSNKVLAFEDVLRHTPDAFTPDVIIHFGNGLCTKRYEQWLQTLACPILLFNSRPILSNPAAISIERYQLHLQTLDWMLALMNHSTLLSWVEKHNATIQKALQDLHGWHEIQILQQAVKSIPDSGQLFIGNSMPIRDLNNYVVESPDILIASNRGASGIDGIPSTALGWMLGNDKPTILVLGDLSMMHDWGVLFTLKQQVLHHPFVILVINNFGGGIFGMLPISKEQDIFDSHFATVHHHKLSPITTAMGIDSHVAQTVSELQTSLEQAWVQNGLHIIEAIVDNTHTQEVRALLRRYSSLDGELA